MFDAVGSLGVAVDIACRSVGAVFPRARRLDFTIGSDGNGSPGVCHFSVEPGASVRLAAEPGVVVDFIHASSREWSTVTVEVDETVRPTGTLQVGAPPLLQKFGSRMNDVHLNVADDDVLSACFAWLDSEGYDGPVHVNSDDGEQIPVQVYPPVSGP